MQWAEAEACIAMVLGVVVAPRSAEAGWRWLSGMRLQITISAFVAEDVYMTGVWISKRDDNVRG